MKPLIVGNPAVFAIESSITEAYESLGQRALGYFVIHVSGKSYGVRSETATLLACSFDTVARRIERRGMHRLPFDTNVSSAELVDSVRGAIYDESRDNDTFFGLSDERFHQLLVDNEIIWAPDGDEAFDDGGHVLQLDHREDVRVVAFKQAADSRSVAESISEARLPADVFYGVLENWRDEFETQWKQVLASSIRH